MGIRRVFRRVIRWKRRQSGIPHEKDIEIFREVLVAGCCPAEAHISGITSQQNMAHAIRLEKVSQDRVSLCIVDHDIVDIDADIGGYRYGQLPESGSIEARSGIEARKLSKVINDGRLLRQFECVMQLLSFIAEAL